MKGTKTNAAARAVEEPEFRQEVEAALKRGHAATEATYDARFRPCPRTPSRAPARSCVFMHARGNLVFVATLFTTNARLPWRRKLDAAHRRSCARLEHGELPAHWRIPGLRSVSVIGSCCRSASVQISDRWDHLDRPRLFFASGGRLVPHRAVRLHTCTCYGKTACRRQRLRGHPPRSSR